MWTLIWGFIKSNWKFAVILLLSIALYLSIRVCGDYKDKYERESNNVDILTQEVDSMRTKSGEYVLTIGELQYTVQDLKKRASEDAELIEELKIRANEVREVVKTVTETKIVYRDTLVMIDPKTFRWSHQSKWWDVDETIDFGKNPPEVNFNLVTRDSLSHIIYRVPKCNFLGIHWGTKGYEIKVVNHNPNSIISYSRWVTVTKNKNK